MLNPATYTYTQLSGEGDVNGATAIVPDTAHGVWISSGTDYSVTHINADGSLAALVDCCGPASAVALDNSGKVWMANAIDTTGDVDDDPDSGSIALLGPDGSIVQDFITGGGVTHPSDLVLDAAGTVWISNLHNTNTNTTYESISELSSTASTTPGTALSPSTGYGLDAQLLLPYGLAVDPSGNIWVSNSGADDLVMFFGLAAPTKTPMPVTPATP
jgi:streptogramin lyase